MKQENADVEYINKLEEHAKKLGEINAKLQDEQVRHSIAMKAIGKKGHEYDAQKFAISEKENEVRNDNANISNIKSQLNAANISVGITESTPIEDRSKRQFQESEKDFSERSRLIKELSDLEQKEATDTANVVELQGQLKEQSAQDLFNKKKEQLEKIKDLEIQLAQETLKSIVTIQDNQFAKEQQNLEIKSRMQGIANQQQIEAINATAGFQITKDNQLAKQAAISASQQNAITAEQNNLALKKAKFDKEAAEAGILMNTALAIAKTLPLLADPLTAAYGAVEIGLITAIGAAQYAAAASTPLPQFFMGGITETPIFRAAEMGTELAITPSGEMSLLKNDGVYSAPIGTEIISNDNLMPYLLANLVNPVNYRGSEPTYPKLDDTRIVDAIQDGNMIAARNRPQSQDIAALLEQGRRIERLTNFKNR